MWATALAFPRRRRYPRGHWRGVASYPQPTTGSLALLTKRLGIDLGTANVLVYEHGKGVVLEEPSVVAINVRDNTVVAVGSDAHAMLGRHPGNIQVIRPMRGGVIADYLITEALLRYLIGRVMGRVKVVRPEVMISVPVGVTGVEGRAVRDAAEAAGARRPAHLIAEPLAAAIGAEIPVGSPRGHMVLDIGGGRTEAAVISMFGIVASTSVRVAGDRLNEAIVDYIKRRHNLVVGERTAEELKIAIGAAAPLATEETLGVRGRDQITGLPRTVVVRSSEIVAAIADQVQIIAQTARDTLAQTPPELVADVSDRGIVMTGGGALLRHLDEVIMEATGVPVIVADDPQRCVAKGAGAALDYVDVIQRSMPTEEESLIADRG